MLSNIKLSDVCSLQVLKQIFSVLQSPVVPAARQPGSVDQVHVNLLSRLQRISLPVPEVAKHHWKGKLQPTNVFLSNLWVSLVVWVNITPVTNQKVK